MKKKAAAAAAAVSASKTRASASTTGRRPRKRSRDGDLASHGDLTTGEDLTSKLPDDILRIIISLLPTKDGASTQVLAHRWLPLWRSSPLNLHADHRLCSNDLKLLSIVPKILSDHPGPTRRFKFDSIRLHRDKKRFAEEAAQIERWFHSRALANLQDLDISFHLLGYRHGQCKRFPLPPSVFLCASSLDVAKISLCDFPKEIGPSVSFPLLKQLELFRVSISEDIFHRVLSSCHVLESLDLESIGSVGCFRISSPTLRSVKLCDCFSYKGKLVIEETPLLERLLVSCPSAGGDTIQVVSAPKLKILGFLSPGMSEFMIENLVFQNLSPSSLKNTIDTVKVLALEFSVPDLNAVIDVLRCFPCLEKLYVISRKNLTIPMSQASHYDSPVKCLETHLKELVLKNYEGSNTEDVEFAKFFVLNAKVLKQIKVGVDNKVNKEWVADQHGLLEMGSRASGHAQLEFILSNSKYLDAHDLSIADPFTCYLLDAVNALSEESH